MAKDPRYTKDEKWDGVPLSTYEKAEIKFSAFFAGLADGLIILEAKKWQLVYMIGLLIASIYYGAALAELVWKYPPQTSKEIRIGDEYQIDHNVSLIVLSISVIEEQMVYPPTVPGVDDEPDYVPQPYKKEVVSSGASICGHQIFWPAQNNVYVYPSVQQWIKCVNLELIRNYNKRTFFRKRLSPKDAEVYKWL